MDSWISLYYNDKNYYNIIIYTYEKVNLNYTWKLTYNVPYDLLSNIINAFEYKGLIQNPDCDNEFKGDKDLSREIFTTICEHHIKYPQNYNDDIIQKWFREDLVECDEVVPFNNLYDSFIIWCENEGINHKKYSKGDIKKELEKTQMKTKYSCVYGEKTKDEASNGTKSYPKFNFCTIEDLED